LKRTIAIVAGVIALILIGLGANLSDNSINLDQAVVGKAVTHIPDPITARETASGPVIGFTDIANTFGWQGIPYAKAPVGQLRWRAPRPADSWQAPRLALRAPKPCIQSWSFLAGESGTSGDIVGGEDCLYLNIWAPQKPSASQLPVMLWIHGGGNNQGSSRFYQGQKLAADQQIIFVSVNYRLGHLGNFSHRSIRNSASSPEDASGNYGLLDIIAALRWIQTNIAVFGGDPGNVTVFGESAGGRNVFGLMASPLAKGLFHRAISQSGSSRTETLASAENFYDHSTPGWPFSANELLAEILINENIAIDRAEAVGDINSMSDQSIAALLYAQPPESLIKASLANTQNPDKMHIPQLLRDGHVLPEKPFAELFADPALYNAVPLIIGSNRDEERAFMASDPRFVRSYFGAIPSIRDRDDYRRFANYYNWRWHGLGGSEMARLMQGGSEQNQVYSYRFDWDESPSSWIVDLPKLVGAGHGIEISFVFDDYIGAMRLPFFYGEDSLEGRTALSSAIMDYWGQFAHSGSPGTSSDGQDWLPWSPTGANTMILDSPADGGWRMEAFNPNIEDIITRIEADTEFDNQRQRCQLFVETFLISYQSADLWDLERYNNLAGGGCTQYSPYLFRDSY
jgi:para-nitrobenzyl esterase